MTKSEERAPFIGTIAIVVAIFVLVLGLSGALRKLLSHPSTYTVRAQVADSQQLKKGSPVRIDGVNAGEVDSITLNDDKRTSTIKMTVKKSAGPLYADAGALLRFKTVLGAAFYVDLERGHANRGRLHTTIPVSRTGRQVEVDDVASVINGRAKSGLQILPGETAKALSDHSAPAKLFESVAKAAPGIEVGVGALRGQVQDKDLRDLVTRTAAAAQALDAPASDLKTLVQGAATTLEETSADGDSIRALLHETPATEQSAQVTLARLTTTLDLADPLLAKLRNPSGDVAKTFAALRPTLVDADDLLGHAVPLLHALRPAVMALSHASRKGLPLLNDLTPSIDRLDKTVLPSLSEKDPITTKSTAVMIGGTFTGLASGAGGQMDANGHFIRFPATSGSSPLNSIPCQVYFNNPDSQQLIACKSISEALGQYLSYNPVGTPGGVEPALSKTIRGRKK